MPGNCVILYYHSVSDKERARFSAQMDDLIRWTKPVAIDKTMTLKNGVRYAAVTFDDGFKSVLDNALVELERRNIPATIFIPTGFIGKHPLWAKNRSYYNKNEQVVTSEQIHQLRKHRLISVGSHCVSHTNLLLLPDADVRKELYESRTVLQSILEQEMKLISFPHGAYNEKIIKMAQEIGYEHIFSISPEYARLNPGEYVSGRFSVNPGDWRIEFRLKLFGAYRWLHYVADSKNKIDILFNKKSKNQQC